MKCRHCSTPLNHSFLDLGFAPPSNAYRTALDLNKPEKFYPLRVKVCEQCYLVQTEDYVDAEEIFNPEYAYFSSTSCRWLSHAKQFTNEIISRMQLSNDSLVIEVACNDGYLLQNFIELGIPCLGVEPTASTADAAEKLGIPVLREFFGEKIGKRLSFEGKKADLVVANNVYAHVPDINDFTRGLKSVLNVNGIISLEFSHLMKMLEQKQFDTIYHEHFSYLSLHSVERIFRSVNLRVWDVEELSTHGGSLRVFGCHEDDARETNPRVRKLLNEEKRRGLQTLSTYGEFQVQAEKIKNNLLTFLIDANCNGRTVAAYGAAAKGNTLLNFAGVRSDLLSYVVDAAVSKQNKYMPGSHIPILHPKVLYENPPDFLLILPWNIASEVRNAHIRLRELGTKFFTAVPTIEII